MNIKNYYSNFCIPVFFLLLFTSLTANAQDQWTAGGGCNAASPSVVQVMIDACGFEGTSEFLTIQTGNAPYNFMMGGMTLSVDCPSGTSNATVNLFNNSNAAAVATLNSAMAPPACPTPIFIDANAPPTNGVVPANTTVLVFPSPNPDLSYLTPSSLASLCGGLPVYVIFGNYMSGAALFKNNATLPCTGCGCERYINVDFGGCHYDIDYNISTIALGNGANITPNGSGGVTYGTGTCNPIVSACVPPPAPMLTGIQICPGAASLPSTFACTNCTATTTWYNAAAGGTLLYTGVDYVPPVPGATTTYYVSNVGTCVSARVPISITVLPKPTATAGNNGPKCPDQSTTLSSSGGGSYAWSGPAGFSSAAQNPVLTPPVAAGSYTVTVTGANTCTDIKSTTITISSPPTATAPAPQTKCADPTTGNASFILGNAGAGTTNWYQDAALTIPASPSGAFVVNISNSPKTIYTTLTGANTCVSMPVTFILTVTAAPTANSTTLGKCGNAAGQATFDLTSVNSTVNGGAGTVTWYAGPGATNPIASPNSYTSSGGTVYATVTVGTCPSAPAAVTLNVNAAPTAIASPATPKICAGSANNTVNLSVTPSGGSPAYTINWTTPSGTANGSPITATIIGNYTYTVTDQNMCTASGTINITNYPTPNATLPTGLTACSGGSGNPNTISATASAGTPTYSYNWTLPDNSNQVGNPIMSPLTGIFTVTVTDMNGCQKTATTTVAASAAPTVNITPASPNICAGASVTLTANGTGGTGALGYAWTLPDGSTAITSAVTSTQTGVYTVTVTDSKGCSVISTKTVNANAQPTASIAGNANFCSGGGTNLSTTLTASGAAGTAPYIYNWTRPNATTFLGNPITATAAGTYTVTVTDNNGLGCTNTATFVVSAAAPPVANAGPDITICAGDPLVPITATPAGLNYLWSPGGATTQTINVSPAATTTYMVTVTDPATGCSSSDQVVVSVTQIPFIPMATSNSPVCVGGNIFLDGTAVVFPPFPYGYTWTFGNPPPTGTVVGSTVDVNIPNATTAMSGTYYFTVSLLGCFSIPKSVVVVVNPAPTANIPVIPPVCANAAGNGVFNLNNYNNTVSGGVGVVTWYSDAAGTVVIASPSAYNVSAASSPLTVYVKVTVGGTCSSAVVPVVLTVNTLPTATATSATAKCRNAAGQATFDLTILESTVNGGTANTISWYANANGTGAISSPYTVNNTTTIYAIVSNGTCSSAAVAVILPVNANPAVSITPNNPGFCAGSNGVVLFANGSSGMSPYNYQWQDPSGSLLSGASITANQAGVYKVTITDSKGCEGLAMINVTQFSTPTITISGNASFCAGSTTNLTANVLGGMSPYTYSWKRDGSPTVLGTTATISASFVDTYNVTVTDSKGCTATQSVVVTQNPSPTVSISPNSPQICAGGQVVLTATAQNGTPNYTYNWTRPNSTIFNGNPITAAAVGLYTVTTTDANGCKATDTLTVKSFPTPTAALVGGGSVCVGSNATLTVNFTGTANFTFVYSVNGVNQPAVNTSDNPYFINIFPSAGVSYKLVSMSDANCTGTVSNNSVTFTVQTPPTYSNLVDTCVNPTQYVVRFTVSAGSTVLPAGSGTLTGTSFVSNPVTVGAPYQFSISNGSTCPPTLVSGSVLVCNCKTEAGTMSLAPIAVCQGDSVLGIYLGGYKSDGNDTLEFILHSTPSIPLGTIFAKNYIPHFLLSNIPGIVPGVTYYISAIAGNNNGSDHVTTGDLCLSVSAGTPVVLKAAPTATLSGTATICKGKTTNLTVNFVGTPPFQIVYSTNGTNSSIITTSANPFLIPVSPTVNTNYLLVSLKDAACSGAASGSAAVTVLFPVIKDTMPFICLNKSIVFNGTIYNQANPSGQEILVGKAANGCDSIINISVQFFPPNVVNYNKTLCFGQSETINGTVYNETKPTGQEIFTTGTSNGCDSVVNVNFTFNSIEISNVNTKICTTDSIIVNGKTYNFQNPNGVETIVGGGTGGCNKEIRVSLSFYPKAINAVNRTLCPGGSVTFNNIVYNQQKPSGRDTLFKKAANGCDSIIIVDLQFLTVDTNKIIKNLCPGQSVTVRNVVYDASNPTDTIQLVNGGTNGCDSIIVIRLTFYPKTILTIDTTLCPKGKLVVNGKTYDENKPTGLDTLFGGNRFGCDSLFNVTVRFYPPDTTKIVNTLCTGQFITVGLNTIFDKNNPSGFVTLINKHGCDSIVAVNLTFGDTAIFNLTKTLCFGKSVIVQGITFDASNPMGTVQITGGSIGGCDSLVKVKLTFLPQSIFNYSNTLCFGDSVKVNKKWYSAANPTGKDTIIGGSLLSGCDSILNIQVNFYLKAQGTITGNLCPNERRIINGTVYDKNKLTGIENLNGQAAHGCDSVILVNLTLIPLKENLVTTKICREDTLIFNNKKFYFGNSSGIDTLKNLASNGCDSVIKVNLSFYPRDTFYLVGTVCQPSLVINGKTYNAANSTGVELLLNATANGCDSIVKVNLKFGTPSTKNILDTLCAGQTRTINSKVYGANNPTGIDTIKFGNRTGCDSILNIKITFFPQITASISGSTTICKGDSATLTFNLSVNGSYAIQFKKDNNAPVTLNNIKNGDQIKVSPNTTAVYAIVSIGNQNNLCPPIIGSSAQIRIDSVKVKATVTSNYEGWGVTCNGTKDGAASVINLISGTNVSYQWSNGATSANITGLAAGIYRVTVTSSVGCKIVDSVNVIPPAPILLNVTGITPKCYGGQGGFKINSLTGGTAPYQYSMNGSPFYTIDQLEYVQKIAGNYPIIVRDANGCLQNSELKISNPNKDNLEVGKDVYLQLGDSVKINPTYDFTIDTFFWNPIKTLNFLCDTCMSAYARPLETTTYLLTVRDATGCLVTDRITVFIDKNHHIFIPNIFSPDGDGSNDFFTIFANNKDVKNVKIMRVFDRWGSMLFETKNINPNVETSGWDGTFNGQKLNSAVFVYYFEVEFIDGTIVKYYGDVTLSN